MLERDPNRALAPLVRTGPGYRVFLAVCAVSVGLLALLYARLIIQGHEVHGTSAAQGASWGITVANIIQFIAISHVGIAVSAIVRILDLKDYRHFARLAELITIVTLPTAVLNIALDIGRPERFIPYTFWFGRPWSPMVWSMTVISIYFAASAVYLYLAIRRDLALCAQRIPQRRGLYNLLALGYRDTPEEYERHKRILWWLALIIIPIMVSVHSVYGMIFGVTAAKPGWYNPLQSPYFVLGAIVSGFAAVIVLAAVLRKAFGWQEYFPPLCMRRLGVFLGFVTWLYIYFTTSELVVGVYGWPEGEHEVAAALISGRFAWLFWPNYIVGYLVPFAILFVVFVSRTWKRIVSLPPLIVASVMLLISTYIGRVLLVIGTYYVPNLPYEIETYVPTPSEWAVTLLTYGFAAFFYALLIKVIPVVELGEELVPEAAREAAERAAAADVLPRLGRGFLRVAAVLGVTVLATGLYRTLAGPTLALDGAPGAGVAGAVVLIALAMWMWRGIVGFVAAVGLGLIATGVYGAVTGPDRALGGASATWVIGALTLVSLALWLCFIRPQATTPGEGIRGRGR